MKNLAPKLEREIISAARRCGIKRVILFGSRARGTNHPRSDIDLAVSGGDFFKFAEDIDQEIDTLLNFDVVNLDDDIEPDFLAEIIRDGIFLYEEVPSTVKKIDAFTKAVNNLTATIEVKPPYSILERVGIIRLFEICFDLSWKALREVLLIHGVHEAASSSPREILKAGYQFHFIDDETLWLDMLKRRNQSAHIYNDDIAVEFVTLIFDRYIAAFTNLRGELERRINS